MNETERICELISEKCPIPSEVQYYCLGSSFSYFRYCLEFREARIESAISPLSFSNYLRPNAPIPENQLKREAQETIQFLEKCCTLWKSATVNPRFHDREIVAFDSMEDPGLFDSFLDALLAGVPVEDILV